MKSIKKNSIIVACNRLLNVTFPLFTYSYITRVLGVENIGTYNYAKSIINYFILLAGIGVASYSVRESSAYRKDSNKMSSFISEIFTINLFSSIASYILLFVAVLFIDKLNTYKILLFIISFEICFTTLGMEWLFTIYEDFYYITVRNFIVKLLSFLFILAFVRSINDLYIYTCIMVIANVGSSCYNFTYARKKVKLSLQIKKKTLRHIRPIAMLFVVDVAINIYTNSDITMLGALKGDYEVGLYSVSVKLYSFIDAIISSIVIASFPQVSAMVSNNDRKGYLQLSNNILESLLLVVIPASVGMSLLGNEIIYAISGIEYIKAISSLKLLCIALIFNILNWYWVRCVILPFKLEKMLPIATSISALINIILNYLLIPHYGQVAAGITTIIAEIFLTIFYICISKGYICKFDWYNLLKIIAGCLMIIICCLYIKSLLLNQYITLIFAFVFSIIVYYLTELILQNRCILVFSNSLYIKFKNKIK